MAVPPSYSDLGKAAKDIFSKGYGEYSFSWNSQLLTLRNFREIFRKITEIYTYQMFAGDISKIGHELNQLRNAW